MAVVLVVDTSGSMMWDKDGNKWDDGNIPAGTKFEDLPEDFECLLCGVDKSNFAEA